MYELLNSICSPRDLKALSEDAMPALCAEIRSFLIESVQKSGGHLASNLGVVELTVAMHRVFDCPQDKFIFDVGHQSYVHKLLTGRFERFSTLRAEDGLSGFTKRSESDCDFFGAGHSSTSVSAALGFAEAERLRGGEHYALAVVGDGAFTGGMIYEALNNCRKDDRLIIILNENEMSISPNVGNLSRHISKVRSTKHYLRFKRNVSNAVNHIPLIGKSINDVLRFLKLKLKGAVYNLNFFENLGLRYMGPVDGNDYYAVRDMLEEAKRRHCCVLLHVKTVKGCGFEDAVKNPEKYHGISPASSQKSSNGSFSEKAGHFLCEAASGDESICAITAAMRGGTGLDEFYECFPDRLFDVGIAEEHAVTFFAGLSAAGKKPVFAVYSTFLQRAYDNLIHDVVLQKLGGLLLIDRAGFACEDGATHHGIYDASFLSQLSGITLREPITYAALGSMIREALLHSERLTAIRYPRGGENTVLTERFSCDDPSCDFPILIAGCDNAFAESGKYVLISYGRLCAEALRAADLLNAEEPGKACVICLQTLKPLNDAAKKVRQLLPDSASAIVFMEEGIKNGGIGMLLREELLKDPSGLPCPYHILAIDGETPEQASYASLCRKAGISAEDAVRLCHEKKAGAR